MLFSMNRMSVEQRIQIVSLLVEGNGINAITRITGVAKNTVLKLLADFGEACEAYHDEHVRGVTSQRIQCDEIWSFCHAKARNVRAEDRGRLGFGDVWTWTAIDADSKLMVSWHVGNREASDAYIFMKDVASRLANRVQLTTDGHKPYLNAVDASFPHGIDYAMIVKMYGTDPEGERRYTPAVCLSAERRVIRGNPDREHINTSYVEKHNQTMRQNMRRYTRLTAGHSKKFDNHRFATALHFVHYNFARICQTVKSTPAMAAGLASHRWTIEELVSLSN
jgi:IS1 family transposase